MTSLAATVGHDIINFFEGVLGRAMSALAHTHASSSAWNTFVGRTAFYEHRKVVGLPTWTSCVAYLILNCPGRAKMHIPMCSVYWSMESLVFS